jgi:hypothetical protein
MPELTCNALYSCLHDPNQVVIAVLSILSSLQVSKWALHGILREIPLPFGEAGEQLWEWYFIRFLSKQLSVNVFGPFFVILTDTRMPSIGKIEFGGNLISDSPGCAVVTEGFRLVESRILKFRSGWVSTYILEF